MATSGSSNHQTTNSVKLIVAAWVDPSIGERGTHHHIKDRFEKLSPFIDHWLYFNKPEDFSNYVERIHDVQLIAVMSGGMARELVPKYSDSIILHSVYLLCFDLARARETFQNNAKVKGIFNIEDALYEHLADDLAKLLVEHGVTAAEFDQRGRAKLHYEEAIRLLSIPMKHLKEENKQQRLQEIQVRVDQLIA